MHNNLSLINIFCQIDDFCKIFIPEWNKYLLETGINKRKQRGDCLNISEIMTILILYQGSKIKNFKTFYYSLAKAYLVRYFPKLPSYSGFLTIQRRAFIQDFLHISSK